MAVRNAHAAVEAAECSHGHAASQAGLEIIIDRTLLLTLPEIISDRTLVRTFPKLCHEHDCKRQCGGMAA